MCTLKILADLCFTKQKIKTKNGFVKTFNKKIIRHKIKRIQSKKHKLGTYEIDKASLSCFDEKRYVLDDGIYTLSYFHKNGVTSCNN